MQMANCTYSSLTSFENKIWYITIVDNLLMEVDIHDGKLVCLGKIPEGNKGSYAYRTLVYRKKCLYLIPYNAEDIWKFEIESRTFKRMNMLSPYSKIIGKEKKLFGILEYENETILYGLNDRIFRVNWDSEQVIPYRVIENEKSSNITTWFWQGGFIEDGILFLPVNKKLSLVAIELNSHSVEYIDFGMDIKDKIYQIVFHEKNRVYFLILDSIWQIHVITINKDNMQLVAHDIYSDELRDIEEDNKINPFQCGFVCNEVIVLLPGRQMMACVIDIKKKRCEMVRMLPVVDKEKLRENEIYPYNYFNIVYVQSKDLIFSINWGRQKMISINPHTLEVKEKNITYGDKASNVYNKVVNQIIDNSNILYEKDFYINLKDYIKGLTKN